MWAKPSSSREGARDSETGAGGEINARRKRRITLTTSDLTIVSYALELSKIQRHDEWLGILLTAKLS
jgi:hypothetical protein